MGYINKQQSYWANPDDTPNSPSEYVKHKERSDYLSSILPNYVDKGDSILEIGCNVGRNLNALWNEGFKNLSGVDINKSAIAEGKKQYPNVKAHFINDTIEKWSVGDKKYDCIFSMAVMVHLPRTSDYVFYAIKNRALKTIITIEDETHSTWKHFPRNYRNVFVGNGWEEVFSEEVKGIPAMEGYVTRVFKRNML